MGSHGKTFEVNIVDGIPGVGDITLFDNPQSTNRDYVANLQVFGVVTDPGDAVQLTHRLYGLLHTENPATNDIVEHIEGAVFADLEQTDSNQWTWEVEPAGKVGKKYRGVAVGRSVVSGTPTEEVLTGRINP